MATINTHLSLHPPPLRVALVVIGILAAGCGNSKTDQCSAVIEKYNVVGDAIRQGFGDGTDPVLVEANVKAVEDATAALSSVEIKDAKLKVARDQLAKTFGDYTTLMTSMAGLLRESKDPAKAEAATAKLTAATAGFETNRAAMVETKAALMTECNATSK